MHKLIITAALVGAEVTREQNPNVPYLPEEIAEAAREAYEAGARMVHLHMRTPDGKPSQSRELFAQTIGLIRERCPVLCQVSTGGAVGMGAEERLQPVYLDPPVNPDMATLNTGTMNFGDDVFENSPALIGQFARTFAERGIRPEIEVYDIGMINSVPRLVKKGLLQLPLHFDLVMGVPGGIGGTPKNLMHMVESLPPDSTWTVAGIGAAELPLAVMAMVLGGHVRVGLEDNIYYRKGELAKSSAQLVARIARIAQELDRPLATVEEARVLLNLEPTATTVCL